MMGLGQELRQISSKIEIDLDRADAPQVIERPNHAGCTDVDAAVTILNAIIEGVRRPEPILPKVIESISGDFGNRLFRCTRIPGQIAQLDVTIERP